MQTDSNKAPHKADQIPVGEAAESDWGEFVEAVEQTQPSKSAAVQHYQRMAAEAALLEALPGVLCAVLLLRASKRSR